MATFEDGLASLTARLESMGAQPSIPITDVARAMAMYWLAGEIRDNPPVDDPEAMQKWRVSKDPSRLTDYLTSVGVELTTPQLKELHRGYIGSK